LSWTKLNLQKPCQDGKLNVQGGGRKAAGKMSTIGEKEENKGINLSTKVYILRTHIVKRKLNKWGLSPI